MFLTEKHPVIPIFPSPTNHCRLLDLDLFNMAVSSRLCCLLPLPDSDSAIEYVLWLCRACQILSLIISDAISLLLKQSSSLDNCPFLDSTSLSLLDSCNSISACCDGLLRRLLFIRFSVKSHKLGLIAEKQQLPQFSMIQLTTKPPRGKLDPVGTATYTVEAVSTLVINAITAALCGKGREYIEGLRVDTEIFTWGTEFNKVVEAVSKRTGEDSMEAQLEKMEAEVRELTVEIDSNGDKTDADERIINEMERTSEEMRDRLEQLKVSVNAVFHSALYARNAAVQSLLVGVQQQNNNNNSSNKCK